MIPKLRLDALTDGIFAFAMTLLVIDLRLPESFHPSTSGEFIKGLEELSRQFIAYILSFFVLVFRWMWLTKLSPGVDHTSQQYTNWSLFHLFLITGIPFSTMVVGRYGRLAPAIWLYSANLVLATLAAFRLATLSQKEHSHKPSFDLIMIIASAVTAVLISFFNPFYAIWAYLLNAVPPLAQKFFGKKPGRV